MGDVLRKWREYVEQAPNEVTSVCVTITFPANPEMPEAVHDRPVAIVGGVYAGDVEQGMKEMQPLRELGTVLFDMSGPTPFTAVQSGFDPLFPRDTLRAYWKALYLKGLDDEAIDVIAARAESRPAPLTLVNTFHMGGAIGDVGPEESAFAERSAPYMVSIDGQWTEEADDAANIEWVRSTFAELEEFGTGGVYLNFTGLADEAPSSGVDDAFGRNLVRLAEIKRAHDPEQLLPPQQQHQARRIARSTADAPSGAPCRTASRSTRGTRPSGSAPTRARCPGTSRPFGRDRPRSAPERPSRAPPAASPS